MVALCGVLLMTEIVDKKIVIGHRGAAGLKIENTISSFKEALKQKVDMIELDVHQCKSGHLVVFHDDSVERLTDGEGRIADLTLAQLHKLKVEKIEQIPTLDEVLQVIDRKCKIDIELKGPDTGQLVAILLKRYLKKGWLPQDFLVTSFSFYELHNFHEALPQVPIGIIFERLPIDYVLFAQQFGAQAIMMHYPLITPSLIEQAHIRNLRVYAWTVNKVYEAKNLIKLGVDGIATDYPNKFKNI